MSTDMPLVTFADADTLSWVTRACLKSAVRCGHPVHLYSYKDVADVPRGVTVLPAEDVIPYSDFFTFDGIAQPEQFGSTAPFSDVFRYELLKQSRGIWIDWDVYCLNPLSCEEPMLLGWEGPRSWSNVLNPYRAMAGNAVMWLPAASPILRALSDLTTKPYKMPPWLSPILKRKINKKLDGRPFCPGAARYAEFGPIALNYFVRKLNMKRHVRHHRYYFPVGYREVDRFLMEDEAFLRSISPDTKTIHLWHSAFRYVARDGIPKDSFAERLREESLDA
ncbi:hypothetical protein [Cognatishimia activa]|uniref:Mannosyltransferase OCH1 n=1 Tax=Cognatishimia activa TaxID=1715691 RepID=A0A0P1IVQ3_9RHOB|nr:hypothetical protein [Cognatishimia activa]CUJ17503.1 hypothetical protein TA5113_02532 [Cognatishimia activa]CUK27563.1 hypothetical protein TA5114_03391 [Cognatishimia activa]